MEIKICVETTDHLGPQNGKHLDNGSLGEAPQWSTAMMCKRHLLRVSRKAKFFSYHQRFQFDVQLGGVERYHFFLEKCR